MGDLDILYKRREYLNTRTKESRLQLMHQKNQFTRLKEKLKGYINIFRLTADQEKQNNSLGINSLDYISGNFSFGKRPNLIGNLYLFCLVISV